jgi:EAL domain-containing protein (putative c-di-GMP-specific phosphodiesterase class I)
MSDLLGDAWFVRDDVHHRLPAARRHLFDLGHAIGINIIAEGVETGEEMTALQAMGADHLQGFLLSRPLEPAALATWVRERQAVETRSRGITEASRPGSTAGA